MRLLLLIPSLLAAAVFLVGCADGGAGADASAPTAAVTSVTVSSPALFDVTPQADSTLAAPDFDPLPGAAAYFGTVDLATYRIEIPSRWNGDLVLWAHGVRGLGPEVGVDSPPLALRRAIIEEGYAWAASSYSENGYVPGIGANDTLKLKRHFGQRFGEPRKTYIAGASLGGHIVVLSLENFPEEYDGGLSLCGAVAGIEFVDHLVAWAMAAEFLAGTLIPLGEGPAKAASVMESSILPALGPVQAPTAAGLAFASAIENLTGGPRPFFEEGYREQYWVNFGLLTGDPDRILPNTRAATNSGVDYRIATGLAFDSGALNRGVRRLAGDPVLRDPAKHPDTAPTTGLLRAPLLTLHETGDLTVPISLEQSYRQKVDAAGRGDLLVQRIIRNGGHCEFSDAELSQAWRDFEDWVRTERKPAGDDVLGDLADAGRPFTNPLRPGDAGAR